MQTYRIKLLDRMATVRGTAPDVALKRFLGGGWAACYTYAMISEKDRFKLDIGETAKISITRIA